MPPGVWVLFIGLLFIQVADLTTVTVQVKKCCPIDEVLSPTDSQLKCIKAKDGNTGVDIEVQAYDNENPESFVRAKLDFKEIGIITCPKTSHGIRTNETDDAIKNFITRDGQVYISNYEKGYFHKDFCIDRHSETKKLTAFVCDPCKSKSKLCYQMFCPHHQAWGRNPAFNETVFYYLLSDPNKAKATTYYEEHPPRACGPGGPGFEPYDPVIWDEEKKQPVGWRRNEDFLLVAPETGSLGKTHCQLQRVNQSLADFTLLTNGSLKEIRRQSKDELHRPGIVYWQPEDFAIVYDGNWTFRTCAPKGS